MLADASTSVPRIAHFVNPQTEPAPGGLAEQIAAGLRSAHREALDAAAARMEASMETGEPIAARNVEAAIAERDRRALAEALDRLEGEIEALPGDVSDLTPMGISPTGAKPDIAAHRCASPHWVGQRHRKTGHVRTLRGRCRECLGCRLHHRDRRHARLLDALGRWERVELVRTETKAEYEALTRRLRRMRERTGGDLAHVSIPLAGGARAVLTEAELGGELVDTEAEALRCRLGELLAGASMDKRARLDGSTGWDKKPERERKRPAPEWEKVGETKLDPEAQAAVFERFGCRPVRAPKGGHRGGLVWDAAHLEGDELARLYWSLGLTRHVQRAARGSWSLPQV